VVLGREESLARLAVRQTGYVLLWRLFTLVFLYGFLSFLVFQWAPVKQLRLGLGTSAVVSHFVVACIQPVHSTCHIQPMHPACCIQPVHSASCILAIPACLHMHVDNPQARASKHHPHCIRICMCACQRVLCVCPCCQRC
jgi:hypothetical protein